jgi:hypothetical protein
MTIAAFLGFVFAYAGESIYAIPNIFAWVIGMLAGVISMRLPTNVTLFFAGIMGMYFALFVALGFVTAILAAAAVSSALFVIISALFGLWIGGIRYGPAEKAVGILSPIMVVFVALFTLGLYELVRDGLSITISPELWTQLIGEFAGSELEALLQQVLEGSTAARDELIALLQQVDLSSLTPAQLLSLVEGALGRFEAYAHLVIAALLALGEMLVLGAEQGVCKPIEDGLFYGRTFCFTLNDQLELTISTEGGIWLVKRFWTWSGIENPLAIFQNFIVAASWTFLCVFIGALLPPWRTMRYELTRIELPLTLRDAAWYMKRRFGTQQQQLSNDEVEVRERLVESSILYNAGLVALATAFEPRLLDNPCTVPRSTFLSLKDLVDSVRWAALDALVMRVVYPVEASDVVEHSSLVLRNAATALETKTLLTSITESSKTKTGSKYQSEDEGSKPTSSAAAEMNGQSIDDRDVLRLDEMSNRIATAVESWLTDLDPSKGNDELTWKDGFFNLLKTSLVYTGPGLIITVQILYVLMVPILYVKGKIKWDTEKISQVIKFAIGYAAIVCMNVYWDAYRSFMVPVGSSSSSEGFTLNSGKPISSFSGWELMAYTFATMFSTEGTVKKCAWRVVGTCIGAFSAWALLRATGDNKYGSVAWLTVTSFFAIYCANENRPGLKQRGK